MKRWVVAVVAIFCVCVCGEAGTASEALPRLPSFLPKIDRKPAATPWDRGTLSVLPKYDPASTEGWQVDVRSFDLSALDLRSSLADLVYASFDSRTRWPPADRMPEGFDRDRILEIGKDPGLGVRGLHARGIDGKGVGIAIIDQPLLVDHVEYKNQLRLYEEINVTPGTGTQMHGAAVASIAVGRSTGVAPAADLYYIGSWTGDWGLGGGSFTYNFAYYAQAIRRVLEVNQRLPARRKIRVIALQIGWTPGQKGYAEITAAVKEAKMKGLLVVSSSLEETFGFRFHGLGRRPFADPNRFESFEPGSWWSAAWWRGQGWTGGAMTDRLLVPMDSRTTASPCGVDEYVFYREGGWSWSIPYLAGLYALGAQVKPSITPEEFWNAALETARNSELSRDGVVRTLGRIADPSALISRLQQSASS